MKKMIKINIVAVLMGFLALVGCSDFEEINIDPKAASVEQVQIEYIINTSITGAQQNPHVAERAFILYWKIAARQWRGNGSLATGGYSDGWSNDYYNSLSDWLKASYLAVNIADEKLEQGTDLPYTGNLKQVARIWRVYLLSEFADTFGPMPLDGYSGVNPNFSDLKSVYYFMLQELKEAAGEINLSDDAKVPEDLSKYDKAYGFDLLKWKKYANSMRMRLAMRLSEVDAQKAKTEFEEAVSGDIMLADDEVFKVKEEGGWSDLTAVMSREWNSQPLSATLNNLYIGLGGVMSADVLEDDLHASIKPANYMGVKYEDHLTSMTNDPSTGFWYDGLHEKMDPRAYKSFIVPGDFDNPNFSFYPSWTNDARTVKRNLVDDEGNVVVEIDATYTWNAAPLGDWGDKASRNKVATYTGTNPRLSQKFRQENDGRIFFAPWETYFLIAEASVRGWSVPISGKEAYEKGIESSFKYWEVEEHLGSYLASEEYNRVGTSVSWEHTTEPTSPVTMDYIDGYTQTPGTVEFNYPKNYLYKNGTVSNDLLTKIITQKYIAQNPWLPLEAWSDHRRLGLPFFENPAVDKPLINLPTLNASNFMTSQVSFFPQRIKYPSALENSNPEGYQQAVGFLGGDDAVLTPLWWAQKE
ncbi:Starch-binding associating with outer membrane [Saccharicrinis carchari]|uniref:Starch-binding associating with outer membrane n=2 Tax=Saccharicrinis carchari TaxID=1168039 RepID=A0A521CYP2_SACCC|nr:Starch-binding associating with outer membrane [Saccharicrinis carchari]